MSGKPMPAPDAAPDKNNDAPANPHPQPSGPRPDTPPVTPDKPPRKRRPRFVL